MCLLDATSNQVSTTTHSIALVSKHTQHNIGLLSLLLHKLAVIQVANHSAHLGIRLRNSLSSLAVAHKRSDVVLGVTLGQLVKELTADVTRGTGTGSIC